ncbi:right-handed parallel beta-helix repeat-containing protein [Candidatus Bathyarchaeota archaeon]|nr:right-handed parallel beta-helix repeat-containing protein [Candidatus Bathyarchaeota archaeon]
MSRKLVFAASLMIVVVGMLDVASDLHVGYASPYIDVNVDTAYNMITNGSYPDLMVFDVRTQSEYDSGHIYGSVWIPHTELEARISELAGHEDHEIIVYCRSGVRSVNASETLGSFNFTKVYNMLGGILAWESDGYPVWNATVHNLNTTFNYDTIQAAIDAPKTLYGHTISVEEGTYYESVVVNKALSLLGESSSTTIVDGNMTGDVVRITRDHVNITGFTIQRSGRTLFNSGISISSTGHCDISGNCIVGNFIGIYGSPKNMSISNNTITTNHVGIDIHRAEYNIISRNRLMANNVSIHIYNANSNDISENNITNNWRSITLGYSRNNRFYHNNFFNNTEQVLVLASGYANFWDNGLEGNYWDNYTSVDSNYDGIGDSPFIIDADNTDNYPLMGAFSEFDITSEYGVQAICNSTISDFQFNNTAITFNVSGEAGTLGFCRICIPKALMNETYRVFVNGTEILPAPLPLPCSNSTHNYIYFNYTHSTQEVVIIPEFPSFLILPLFMIATLLAAILYKRKSND